MSKNLIYFTIAVVLLNISCGQNSENYVSKESTNLVTETPPLIDNPNPPPISDPDPNEDHSNIEDPDLVKPEQPEELCYYGEQKTEKCLTLSLASEEELNTRYRYLNPNTNSSFPRGAIQHQYRSPLKYLDLNFHSPETQLTQNFKLDELMQTKKGPYAIYSPLALYYIQKMRLDSGRSININSGYRSPGYNALIGGAKWSRHMYGDALDFTVSGRTLNQAKELCLKHGASFFQLYKTHIHCDWRNSPLNEKIFGPQVTSQAFFTTAMAEKNSQILVESQGEFLKLSVKTDFVEDNSEELHYEWLIRNGKDSWSSNDPILLLPKSKRAYTIDVVVGGSINLKTQIAPQKN
jgi:hypothetical protein